MKRSVELSLQFITVLILMLLAVLVIIFIGSNLLGGSKKTIGDLFDNTLKNIDKNE